VAAVETALMLPLLVLLAFGSIELSNMVFMRQSLAIAAYEGVRAATKPGTAATEADTRIRDVLTSRNITNFSVQYTTTDAAPLVVTPVTPRGTMVTVTVSSANGGSDYGPLRLFTGRTIQCQSTMVRQ
jgi:Flp pilus assembly protein TadG